MRSGKSGVWVVLLVLGIALSGALLVRMRSGDKPAVVPAAPPVAPPVAQAPPPSDGPRVLLKGRVVFAGDIPEPAKLEVTKDKETCECPPGGGERRPYKLDESLVVDPATRGIAHAVVWVKGLSGGQPRTEAVVDQRGCQFVPHVALLTPGGRIKLLNGDRLAHNYAAHSRVPGNPTENLSVQKHVPHLPYPANGSFAKPEFVRVTCDIHAWMQMWVAVVDGGFAAVTDEHGAFSIPGVPEGPLTLCVWQERLAASPQERAVTVGPGGGEVEISLKP